MPIFLLLVGVVAFFAGRASQRGDRFALGSGDGGDRRPPSVEIFPPGHGPRMPSPNRVLDEVVKMGAFPPPHLVQACFAESQACNDAERCKYIIGAFMAPVVQAAQAARQAAQGGQGSASDVSEQWVDHAEPVGIKDGRGWGPYGKGYWRTCSKSGMPCCPLGPNGERLDQSYDWKPVAGADGFQMLPPINIVPGAIVQAPSGPSPSGPNSLPTPLPDEHPSGGVGPAAEAAQAGPQVIQGPNGTVVVAEGTPLAGVLAQPPFPDLALDKWCELAAALECDAPDFTSNRHVGRYRHNRERLAQLGIDAQALVGRADAQDAALAADIAHTCAQAHSMGLVTDFVGGEIDVPSDNGDLAVPVTLSGMIGVAHAAGLEGAAGWLTKPGDRRRFPHTTAAFWRSNGVF